MKTTKLSCAIAALFFCVTAWAAPPERLPVQTFSEAGTPIWYCIDGDFYILRDTEFEVDAVLYFNVDGSPKKAFYKIRPNYDILYNSEEPSFWLATHSDPTQRWVSFKDGDPVFAAAVNKVTVTAPGYGVVFQVHQRLTINFVTGEVFSRGPDDLSAGNFDGLCAPLRHNP